MRLAARRVATQTVQRWAASTKRRQIQRHIAWVRQAFEVPDVDQLLSRNGGSASRAQFFGAGVSRYQLDHLVKRGELVAVYPRAYARPWACDQIEVRERAAMTSVGPPATVSHLSSLRRWGLLDYSGPVHVTVLTTRGARPHPDLVVHRVERFPPVVKLRGLITTTAASAIATSWPLLPDGDRRAPAIRAVREHIATPDQIADEVRRHTRLRGRAQLRALSDLLANGCESELEIWGHLNVFDHPGLRHGVRQHVVSARGRRYRIDLAYRVERVAVELDGAAYHFGREARERDMARDAALTSVGWVTLRFSHHRLHDDVTGCRRDLLDALRHRQ